MIDPILFTAFLAATAVLIITPGPVVGLVIARTLADGRRHGFAVAGGAATVSIIFLALGLGGFIGLTTIEPQLFDIIRYVGAAYIFLLAVKAWREPIGDLNINSNGELLKHRSLLGDYRKSVLVTASSPKTILFFGAFFPMFISPDLPRDPQLWVMAVGFLSVSVMLDTCWVMLSGWARKHLLAKQTRRTINRISGTVLACGAIALLFLSA